MTYFSSHNHTYFSNYRLLDATNSPTALFDRAVDLGLSGFAVTDHEALSAHVQIMQHRDKLIKNGTITEEFTVGFGDEAYLVDELGMGIKYYHWLLIAKDEKGHKILRNLSSQAWSNSYWDRGMERVPLTKDQVEEIMDKFNGKGHIIATSACLGGELGYNALKIKEIQETSKDEELINSCKGKMVEYVKWNQKVFGKDFYIELAPNDKADQRFSNNMLWNLAKSMNIPVIYATDSHYISKEDQDIHRAFLNSKEGEREVDEFYSVAYMMDKEEVQNYFLLDFSIEEIEEMESNLEEMRKGISSYTLFRQQEIPKVEVNVPELYEDLANIDYTKYPFIKDLISSDEDQNRYWINTCLNRLKDRNKWNDLYLSTLNLESEVIVKVSERMNAPMASYYNTAQKLVEIMWDEGDSLVGTSRGSAMAFVSNWLLDITQIDPIPYKIPYWRHLSASRPELPDVDLDSQGFKREQVIEAVKKHFGEDRVLNICTYSTEGTKSAIATAARGLGIDNDISLYLSGLVPNERGFDWSLKDIINGNQEKGRSPVGEFVSEISKHDGLLKTAMGIEGMVTSRGSHASGVYIFNHDYRDINALMKTPNGSSVTQWDMHESDEMGGLKFDFLSIEGLDKIRATMDLLIDSGDIEWQGGLKATYDKYLHPDVLDYSPEQWEPAWEGKVLDLFQFQTPVGGEAIKKGKPITEIEGAAINSLMRLMPMADGTVPIDKFVKFKNDISLWYKELEQYNIPVNEIETLERHYLQSFGVPNTQEEMMLLLMDNEVCQFTELEANVARKIVGKKQMEKIPWLKEEIFNRAVCSKEAINYIWDTAISVQLGYSFSLPHTIAYTVIALQELNLFNNFPSIYWNTGCLIINSGDDKDSTDYAKIAVALGNTIKHDIKVELVDINESDINFKPNVEKNYISYGLRPLSGIGFEFIERLIENRPYTSLKDFVERVKPNKTQAISLIKAGAFEKIEGDRRLTLMKYAKLETAKRKQISITQIPLVWDSGIMREEDELCYRVYNFNKYLKDEITRSGNFYKLDERSIAFLEKVFDEGIETNSESEVVLDFRKWSSFYENKMNIFRKWSKENLSEIIQSLRIQETIGFYKEIGAGTLAKWEMDSMSFYYTEHELVGVDTKKYNIIPFSSLSREPYGIGGTKKYPKWETYSIMGTIVGKNKTKGSIDLLTPEGDVVLVKMYKGNFSYYDKQVSEKMSDGTKKVIEKSFFERGNKIFIHGYRRDDQFLPKSYSDTFLPEIGLIKNINPDGSIVLKTSRG